MENTRNKLHDFRYDICLSGGSEFPAHVISLEAGNTLPLPKRNPHDRPRRRLPKIPHRILLLQRRHHLAVPMLRINTHHHHPPDQIHRSVHLGNPPSRPPPGQRYHAFGYLRLPNDTGAQHVHPAVAEKGLLLLDGEPGILFPARSCRGRPSSCCGKGEHAICISSWGAVVV